MKTFREYLKACEFDAVWPEIVKIFGEPEGLRPVYEKYFNKLLILPARKQTLGAIVLAPIDDEFGNLPAEGIDGAPDYLIEKPVNTNHVEHRVSKECIAAVLLYWSSMISFHTSKEHDDDLFEWLRLSEADDCWGIADYLMGSIKSSPYGELKAESLARKQKLFWGDTAIDSDTTSWHGIFNVLKRKLEFNRIFLRGYADHDGRERDAERMELCCRLIDIATSDREIIGEPRYHRALHLLFKVLEDNLWRWDD